MVLLFANNDHVKTLQSKTNRPIFFTCFTYFSYRNQILNAVFYSY